jgi:serine/threonine-protein kinase
MMERLNAALTGRYTIEGQVGEGGMATVYLAKDLKHNRSVALKVLKPELAAVVGADRFLAEIETTANLQHPHILPLFDSGEADGFLFYVMPYVEGETLRDRIERDKQLPVDEAVRIATAVAGALQVAHDKGIIHRDIKPANILLSGGQPLVADFGIALAVGAGGSSRLTETGLSVGTPYYMSPEQATGDRAVGPASDIYALAAVLYEMLTGDPPYVGSTAQAVLGKILQGQPVSATASRKAVPAHVDAAIRKGLEKLPADRFTKAGSLADALANPGFRYGEEAGAQDGAAVGRWKRLAVGFGFAAAVLAGVSAWALLRSPEAPTTIRATLDLDPPPWIVTPAPGEMAIADDGSFVVYTGARADGTGSEILIRPLDGLESMVIQGTDYSGSPTISPDGRDVAFIAPGSVLRAVPLAGGASRILADSALCCTHWGTDGFVYFTTPRFQIGRVPAAGGGAVEVLTDEGEGFINLGARLTRDGATLLFGRSGRSGVDFELTALRLATGDVKVLLPGVGVGAETASGHLLGVDASGTLVMAPFDGRRVEITGPPTPVVEGVALQPGVNFAVSSNGTLIYVAGSGAGAAYEPAWVDRSGRVEPVDPNWTVDPVSSGNNAGLALSPDGSKIAVGIRNVESPQGDIYIKELPMGPFSRLTYDPAEQTRPRWSADGRYVTYVSGGPDGLDYSLMRRRADGTGQAEVLFRHPRAILDGRVTGDGWTIMRLGNAAVEQDVDIGAVPPGGDSVTTGLFSRFKERAPALSPDGRWLAYESDETGRTEVYIRSFPDPDQLKQAVSTGGGTAPVWGRTGRELFFVNGAREMVAVDITLGDEFRLGDRTSLFQIPSTIMLTDLDFYSHYDVDVDDQRFLMLRSVSSGSSASVVLVVNWLDEALELVGR